MKKQVLLLSLLIFLLPEIYAQKQYTLGSPDGTITVTVETGKQLSYSVTHGNTQVLDDSPIAMTFDNGVVLGSPATVTSVKTNSANEEIRSDIYKKAVVLDNYNELVIGFENNYEVIFRAYNDGVAYRFQTHFPESQIVVSERADFNFDEDYTSWVPYVYARRGKGNAIDKQFFTSFENTYTLTPLSKVETNRLIFLPAMVELKDGKKVVITEADLESFPGLLLRNKTGERNFFGRLIHRITGERHPGFTAIHARYPKVEEQGGHNNLQYVVQEREDYIAKVEGERAFPWRCMVISEHDTELANSDMVYRLASPSRVDDISWIKPGKVAWDWWNDWNIYGVDFKSGINNDTYKYYIDFASQYGIQYVILDEGWAVNKQADLFQIIPEIDLEELIAYGNERNVGLVLWAGYAAIDKDMEQVCKHYSDMGIKGFKVDFMDRDDQEVVEFYYRMAETAAKYHLFIDFHGAYKPTGMNRTYPNVLNFEGVFGLEQCKWDNKSDMVTYEVTIPFIRMVAGPFDFTQGAMNNASQSNYHAVNSEPMSQGTRCRQLAEYVIFESPFNMLCDSPSNYLKEDECTQFIANVPTTWDETVVLDGKVGEYLVIARRKDFRWYIGAITNWEERDIELDLSVLRNGGAKSGELFRDGANANRVGKDYVHETAQVMANKVNIHLAQGGGAVLIW